METIPKPKLIGLRELVNSTLKTYADNWQKFATLLIIPLSLSFLMSSLFFALKFFYNEFNLWVWLICGFLIAVIFVVFIALYFFSYLSQFLLLNDLNQEVKFSNLKDWYKRTLPYIWPIALVSLVYSIFAIIGFLALIIPGIIIMVYYSFAIYAVMFENNKFEGAFGRSRELVKGYWWAVFGRFLAGLLLIYLAYLSLAAIFWLLNWAIVSLLKFYIPNDLAGLLYNLLSVFIGLVAGPLTIIYTYKIYSSLREIKR